MSGIINLLPDSLANQIAAGEVIQRPASVVKELLENAIDAGAKHIKLIIKDSGKTLIQVVDDGSGMSEIDARMCFERHATSKIKSSDDLFSINSFGFRGEALSSIAAISHVDLKTHHASDSCGTHVHIMGNKIKRQEASQNPVGTSISVKNLFFNVPARRKFLKSDPVELKHILEEFTRIALPNHDIYFTVHHNKNELYHFPPSNFRQRISSYFGKNVNEKIVPVNEETDFVKVLGFVGRPELIKKSRGDQFLFVNQRFIKSNYLNHAVKIAYENLIPSDSFPFYVLMIDIDPAMIDVNIHPTKQEIKFENERLIYNLVRVSVKHALGKYSITPSIDFEKENFPGSPGLSSFPSVEGSNRKGPSDYKSSSRQERQSWTEFYHDLNQASADRSDQPVSITLQSNWEDDSNIENYLSSIENMACFQLHNSYIISPIKSGILVIDQEIAHERIKYEKYLGLIKERKIGSQKTLFPETLKLNPKNVAVLEEVMDEIESMGFEIEKFGKDTFIINAIPSEGFKDEPASFIENIVIQLADDVSLKDSLPERIAASMARQSGIRKGQKLELEEMKKLIDELFACKMPYAGPSGKKCFITFGLEDLQNRFIN